MPLRLRDARVKGQVGVGRQVAGFHAGGEGLVRLLDRLELFVGVALGGQARSVAFERDAHFLAAQVGGDVLGAREALDAQGRLMADKGAEPLVRRDEAIGAQPLQGLADHRPGHTEALRNVGFRGQLVADLHASRRDLLEHLAVELVGKTHSLARREDEGAAGPSESLPLERRPEVAVRRCCSFSTHAWYRGH